MPGGGPLNIIQRASIFGIQPRKRLRRIVKLRLVVSARRREVVAGWKSLNEELRFQGATRSLECAPGDTNSFRGQCLAIVSVADQERIWLKDTTASSHRIGPDLGL